MSEQQTKILATVIDVKRVNEDRNWEVTLVADKGVTYVRFFYSDIPPSINEEHEITI